MIFNYIKIYHYYNTFYLRHPKYQFYKFLTNFDLCKVFISILVFYQFQNILPVMHACVNNILKNYYGLIFGTNFPLI